MTTTVTRPVAVAAGELRGRTPTDMGLGPRRRKPREKSLSQAAAVDSLQRLADEPHANLEQRNDWLKALGYDSKWKSSRAQYREEAVSKLHRSVATSFNKDSDAKRYSDGEVCSKLKKHDNLQYLFARGLYQHTILHTILDHNAYGDSDEEEFNFGRLKPLIRFLIWLQPELPKVRGGKIGATPLFLVLEFGPSKPNEAGTYDGEGESNGEDDFFLEDKVKAEILRFLCNEPPDGLGSAAAVESLALVATSLSNQRSDARHAVHAAIERDFPMPNDIISKLHDIEVSPDAEGTDKGGNKPCLEVPDRRGRTCLHIALTAPFTKNRIAWAKQLAQLQPSLLKTTYRYGAAPYLDVTPLQHLALERNKSSKAAHKERTNTNSLGPDTLLDDLKDLEDFLKCRCLEVFDNETCMSIMYTKDNERQVFLTLEDETISTDLLESQSSHYRLDKSLKAVHILSNNRIQWDDRSKEVRNSVAAWRCPGNTDLYMVFQWLKDTTKGRPGVTKVFEVMVHDPPDSERGPHSDRAIVECLRGLRVETWDWRRMDIPADVIVEAAGDDVKTVFLYCSGLRAVLQSWSDTNGLVRLKNLEKVEVEIHQGLESIESVHQSAAKFKSDLEALHKATYQNEIENKLKKELEVNCIPARKKKTDNEEERSSIKSNGDLGYEEQEWLRCMDSFANLMEYVEMGSRGASVKPVKIALIDDGVKTSYAALDDNIHCGKSGWGTAPAAPKGAAGKKSTKAHLRSYNSSHTGHGTVMAYYLCRVCPKAKLCIAKLDPDPPSKSNAGTGGSGEQVTFSIESVTEAIKWAVSQEVDIISMSWAIEPSSDPQDGRVTALQDALMLATKKNILLFCANPDKGPGYPENKTYPKQLVPEKGLFCIGAARDDGKRWGKIHEKDDSCDFFLPGVDLGIQVESMNRKNAEDPPHEWHKYSGSSLSCALAAGLAAMVLHCTQVSGMVSKGDARWNWLKTGDGMSQALQSINVDRPVTGKGEWLSVGRLFGKAVESSQIGGPSVMLKSLKEVVVSRLLTRAPLGTGTRAADPASGSLGG